MHENIFSGKKKKTKKQNVSYKIMSSLTQKKPWVIFIKH